jgi:hypothetical protein
VIKVSGSWSMTTSDGTESGPLGLENTDGALTGTLTVPYTGANAQGGSVTVTVTATDPIGNPSSESFSVGLAACTLPPPG